MSCKPPPMRWWGRTFVAYRIKEDIEERVIVLRLPSWGMGYCINTDDERWGQRVLLYRGRNGLSLNWYFPPTSEEVMRSYTVAPDQPPTRLDVMYDHGDRRPEPFWRRWWFK